jgi:GT2 family glycosyltransferase
MDLSIIIVPYRCKDRADVTLEAVYNSKTNYSYEVIVVDNDSQDGTVEMIRQKYLSNPEIAAKTTLIENTNEGFVGGNNRGLALAKGGYVLLLNPDTKLAPDNLQVMLDFMKSRPDVGAASCKLIKENGEIDWASRRSEPDPKVAFYRLSGLQKLFPKKFGSYNKLDKSVDEESEVDAIVGAYMMISRECLNKVHGFDPDFFMYGEDLDLCFRIRQAGYKVWYYPKTYSYHYKGQSSKKASAFSLYHFHNAMWVYYKKHYKGKYNFLMDAFVYVGVWGRYALKRVINNFKIDKAISK